MKLSQWLDKLNVMNLDAIKHMSKVCGAQLFIVIIWLSTSIYLSIGGSSMIVWLILLMF